MPESPDLLEELKRRKVVRAGLVYGAFAFATLQVADIVVEPMDMPVWTMQVLIWLLLMGFGVTLTVSWFFDVVPDDGEGESRGWMSARAVIAMVALVALGMGAGWLVRPMTGGPEYVPPPLDADVAVVMPFTVLGSGDASYLSDAVARLLTSGLDGTAGIRTVSSHALMGYPGVQDVAEVTEPLAAEISNYFGAGIVLMGTVVEAGDSLRIDATLLDRATEGADPVTASVTAVSSDLFSSIDELATLLVAEREAGTGSVRTRTAATTTTSLEALRAYIDGERAFRSGSYLPAVDAFTRAIEADSTFALAFYRLSMTEERLAWAEASRVSAEAASRHAERLSPREREFLEAVVALRRGNTSEAEQMLRTHLREHVDDPEAWYQLGEILFHGEPLRGGSMTAAREPLEIALLYDPADLGAIYHLVRIAVKEGDDARVNELSERFIELSQGERTLELRALQAASQADTAAFEGILEEMRGSPDPFVPIATWSVATFGQDPSGAERIARVMTGEDRPVEVRGAGYVQLAHLAMAQGRLDAAMAALDEAERLGDPDAEETRAWITAMPFVPSTDAELREARAAMAARRASAVAESPRPSSFYSAQNGVHEIVAHYLEGVISARLLDEAGVEAAASALDDIGETESARELARQLAVGVRAQGAMWSGDEDVAANLLLSLSIEGWYELTFVSPYYSGALERFTLAELLFRAGRDQQALAWFEGLLENNVAELVFSGPVLMRSALIHRRAGDSTTASEIEGRFGDLWRGSDAELVEFAWERFAR